MAVIVAGLGSRRWGRIVHTHAAVHVEPLVTCTAAQKSTWTIKQPLMVKTATKMWKCEPFFKKKFKKMVVCDRPCEIFPWTRKHPQRTVQCYFCIGWIWNGCLCFQPYSFKIRVEIQISRAYFKAVDFFLPYITINDSVLVRSKGVLPKVLHHWKLWRGTAGFFWGCVTQVDVKSFILGYGWSFSLKIHGHAQNILSRWRKPFPLSWKPKEPVRDQQFLFHWELNLQDDMFLTN